MASGSFTSLAAGSYTVNILDANNCPTSVSVVIAEPAVLVLSEDAVTDATCGDANGAFTVSASGGITAYSYDIGTGAQASGTFSSLVAGGYSVTVTDAQGCTDVLAVTVADLSGLTASITTQADADCNGAATGSVTLLASGSTAPYAYAIDGITFGASGTFGALAAGSYTITAQDANNCTIDVPVTIAEPTPVVGALDATTDADCNGAATGSASVSASGGTAPYTYDIGSGPVASGTFTSLAAGSYSVTVLDANDCSDVVAIVIAEPTPMVGAILSQTDPLCFGGSDGTFEIDGSGGTPGYQYDLGTGAQASALFSAQSAGTHSVDIIDANGCIGTISITLNEPIEVLGAIDNQTDASCSGMADATVDVSASGGTPLHTFDIGNGPQVSGSFTDLLSGSYSITAIDGQGCTANILVDIIEPVSLMAAIVTQTEVSCFAGADASVEIAAQDGTGPYTFDIGNGTQATGIFTGLSAGNYSVTVADANGCSVTVDVVITEPTQLSVTILTQTEVSCFVLTDGDFEVEASGATPVYSYDIGSGPQATGVFNTLIAGIYTATVIDANGCTETIDVTISEPTLVTASILSQTDPLCFAGNDGSFEIEGNGGTPTYQFDMGTGPQTNSLFTSQTAGTYSIDVIDANGCTDNITVTLSEPTELLGTIDVQTGASCSGIADGTVDLSASGGMPPYTYDIGNGPQTSGSFIGLFAGTYSVTIEDGQGCTVIVPVDITEPVSLSSTIVSQTAVSCFAGADGTVELTAQDGTGPYTFDIGNGTQATGIFSGLSAGNYTVTAADANGCSVAVGVVITEPTELTSAILSQSDLTCFGSNDGEFEVLASGAIPTYSYDIGSGPQATGVFIDLLPNTYTVNILDANSCTTSIDVVISEPNQLVIDAGVDQTICDGETASLNVIGAASYTWGPLSDLNNPNIANPDFIGLTTTTLTVIGTDADGCIATDDVTLTVNALPPVDAGADEVICTGFTVQLGASGAISYVWNSATNLDDGSIQNPTFSGTLTETLTVTGTDGNGCENSDDVIVIVNDLPVVDAGADEVICEGQSVQLQASGGVSYTWGPQTGLNNYALSNPVFSGTNTTTYTVTSIDGNGCTDSDEITITVNAILPVDAGLDTAICFGETVQLLATGASTYVWSPVADLDDATIANPLFNGIVITIYSVTGTDVNGCNATDYVTVTVDPLPIVDAGLDEAICIGDQVQLGVSGAVLYEWSPATGLDDSQISTPIFSGTSTALITVTGTDGNGCVNTDDIEVVVNPLPIVDAGSDVEICSGFTTQLVASGATDYTWNPIANLDDANVSNPVFSGIATTLFTITGTDGNGCANTDNVEVILNDLPVADAGTDVEICVGQTTQLNASGAANFSWDPSAGLDDATIANPTFSGITTTLFTVTVTDASGCQDTDVVEVTVHALPNVAASADVAICIGDQTQLSVSGADTYVWTPGADLDDETSVSPTFSGLSTTQFNVTGTDVNGCVNTDDVEVIVNPLPVVDAGFDEAICFGDVLQLEATGATNYAWNQASDLDNAAISNPIFSGGSTTTFTVTVTDDNGCVNTDEVTITVNQLPAVDAGVDQSMCEGESVQLTVVGIGSPIWFPGGSLSNPTISNPVATPTTTQEYVVRITDAAGCLNTDTVVVTVMLKPTAVIIANLDACQSEIIQFESASLGNIATTNWNLGDGNSETLPTFDHSYPLEGSYQVILAVTTDEGCADTTSHNISVHPNPNAIFSVLNVCLLDEANFMDQSTVNSGSITTWNWDFGDSNSATTQNAQHGYATEGTYAVELVVGTDFGCLDSVTKYIIVHPMPVADFTIANACAADTIATITDNSSIVGGTITDWQWVLNSTDTIIGQFVSLGSLPVGIYSVELTVWSDEGCISTMTQDLEIYPLPAADFSATVVCEGLETEFTDLSTGTAAYPITEWDWMIDGIQSSIDTNPVYIYGTYGNQLAVLEVTNSAGCTSQITQDSILVHPAPVVGFNFTSHFCENDSVFFVDQSSVPLSTNDTLSSWSWSFDAVDSAFGQTSNYVFTEFGDHVIILNVATNNGCMGSDTQTVRINPLPNVVIEADQFEGCQVLPVQFWSESTIQPGYYLDSWAWTFGDGSDTLYAQHPGHDFLGAEPGDTSTIYYDVSLTVTSSDGCVATLSEDELITVYANPTALYETNFYNTDLNDPLFHFTNQSSEDVIEWYWEFGDGDYTDEENPRHTYADTGSYEVTLLVTTINGCTDFIDYTVRVNPVFVFYIPNSFTPNGNDLNEFFFGQGQGYIEYNMMIYDRWGEEIFESHHDQFHWDGSYKGNQVQQDIYVYRFEIIDWMNHQHIYTGTVTLHR
jgi:gliding motility-associated-like protein